MLRVAVLVHILLMTVLMGGLVLVVLSVPSLAENARKLIPMAALAGFVVTIPVSALVARRILAATGGR